MANNIEIRQSTYGGDRFLRAKVEKNTATHEDQILIQVGLDYKGDQPYGATFTAIEAAELRDWLDAHLSVVKVVKAAVVRDA